MDDKSYVNISDDGLSVLSIDSTMDVYLKNTDVQLIDYRKTIYIKKFSDIDLPTILPNGNWIDLAVARDTGYNPGDFILIPLGFAMQLPEGYEAHILPRSSTFKKYGLLHASSGLIDESYCGNNDEWLFGAYATRRGEVKAGTRICQFRIVQIMPPVKFVVVEALTNKDRGGYGSTGD